MEETAATGTGRDGPTRLVVDAMNVIGTRPTGWWRDRPGAIRDLVARLQVYAAGAGRPVTVVVDGRPLPDLPEGAHGPVDVHYARRPGRDAADDRIVELLGADPGPAEVATADRDLRSRVERLGATVVGPGTLLRELDRLDRRGRNPATEVARMELAKGQIVEFFLRRDDVERAQRADDALPDTVDLREHAGVLRELGIDPGLLATQIDNLEA